MADGQGEKWTVFIQGPLCYVFGDIDPDQTLMSVLQGGADKAYPANTLMHVTIISEDQRLKVTTHDTQKRVREVCRVKRVHILVTPFTDEELALWEAAKKEEGIH